MPKKKKEKVPSYEPPPPLLSPARGRLGTPPTVEDGRWNSLVMDSKVLPVFCGVLHGPGWTEPPKSAAADGEEKKPAKKKTAKKKAGSKGERPKTTGGVNWDKFDKSYLVNTYTVGLPSPPWSKPTEERCGSQEVV